MAAAATEEALPPARKKERNKDNRVAINYSNAHEVKHVKKCVVGRRDEEDKAKKKKGKGKSFMHDFHLLEWWGKAPKQASRYVAIDS